MTTENHQCKNCKTSFTIEPDDFAFYEKIKVPPPTWCPECRLKRRLMWRNERTLYKRKCDAPGHSEVLISTFPQEYPGLIYDEKYWWTDNWDPLSFGKEYDPDISFSRQFSDLFVSVPHTNLINIDAVNSDYCNFTFQSKNCYLNFASDMNEDTGYLYHSIHNKNSYDMVGSKKNEFCYELVDCEGCYQSAYLQQSEGCINTRFLYNCRNCQDCFGCVNLRNAKNHIFNEPYTPEEYRRKIAELWDGSVGAWEINHARFVEEVLKRPHRFADHRHVNNVTGDYIYNAKNCFDCFDIEGSAEDCRFVVYGVTDFKNVYDAYGIGVNLENSYEVIVTGSNVNNTAFSADIWDSFDIRYSYYCRGSAHLFGCVGLRNKKYCILNRQYTREEYEALTEKILQKMLQDDEYGEFFPMQYSPFAYNETTAQELFPITKTQVLERGLRWKDPEVRHYKIGGDIVACEHDGNCNEQCTTAFKTIPQELQFYQRMNIPLPRLCPNCRHHTRLAQRNPLKLWHRKCMKEGCSNEFETSYAPDRPEIVYCEQCYQREIS